MSFPKPLSSKPMHVKANTVIGKENISSSYTKRFYNKHQYQQDIF